MNDIHPTMHPNLLFDHAKVGGKEQSRTTVTCLLFLMPGIWHLYEGPMRQGPRDRMPVSVSILPQDAADKSKGVHNDATHIAQE